MSVTDLKMTIDTNSPAFKWVKSLTFSKGNYILNPAQRNDEFNALVYLTCLYLKQTNNIDAEKLDPFELLKYTAQGLSNIVYMYVKLTFHKLNINFEGIIVESVNAKILGYNFSSLFEAYILKLMSNSNSTPFILDETVDILSFGKEGESSFIKEFIKEFIPHDYGTENIKELTSGMNVCSYILDTLIMKKEKSEIWKAVSGRRVVCLKLEYIEIEDKELKKLTKSANFEKIVKFLKETDQEYICYNDLKDFPYKVDYFGIDYYSPLNYKVKIFSWYDGPVNKIIIEDKKRFLTSMTEILFELHKRRIMFNNISPNHIMIKKTDGNKILPGTLSNYRLIDYKHVCKYKELDNNTTGNYKSLSLISSNSIVTPYDDIESLFYTFNELISGKVIYSDLNDEIIKKSQLNSFPSIISEAITNLRLLKQQDIYINGLNDPEPYEQYIDIIYKNGINGTKSIMNIIIELMNKFNEVRDIEISLSAPDYALLKKIRNDLVSNPHFKDFSNSPTKLDEIALEILNFMINGSEPLPGSMIYISAYLA